MLAPRPGVVTWKSGEAVGTFLRRIGAGAALLELEARQVSRALRGELNRVLNAESANLQRAVAAAGRQLDAIDRLEADGRLAAQPRVVRAVAAARRETPAATLAELASRWICTGPPSSARWSASSDLPPWCEEAEGPCRRRRSLWHDRPHA